MSEKLENIAKQGDKIKYIAFDGKEYIVNVAIVNEKEQNYGVYAPYGQDLIPFNQCEIIYE